jgi:gamma-glutamylcyclotransferase (GGCT)/AIG2-like uncharacterized protein YtfP
MNVFTYGSLMFAEVWTRVVRGQYRQSLAVAHGYRRYAVRDETYPGMIPDGQAEVGGVVYFNVNPADLEALDAFEGEDYCRAEIMLRLPDGGLLQAQTYLYLPTEKLSGASWEPESFQMQRFLETYVRQKLGE